MQHVSKGINNWDLIDTSSEYIIGPYISTTHPEDELILSLQMHESWLNLWINRIIVLASFHQIKQGNGKLTIYIAGKCSHISTTSSTKP